MINEIEAIISSATAEKSAKNIIDESTCSKLFNTDYSQALLLNVDKKIFLFRGMQEFTNEKRVFFTMAPSFRRARNSNNVYTMMISEILPSWKNYPKRNNCIIMTNSKKAAGRYGELICRVFPKNDANIVICPVSDMWDAFNDKISKELGMRGLNNLNRSVSTSLTALIIYNRNHTLPTDDEMNETESKLAKIFVRDAASVENIIAKCESVARSMKFEELDDLLMSDAVKNTYIDEGMKYFMTKMHLGESLIGILDDMLDPVANGFKIKSIKDINESDLSLMTEGNEMWTDSECLFAKVD